MNKAVAASPAAPPASLLPRCERRAPLFGGVGSRRSGGGSGDPSIALARASSPPSPTPTCPSETLFLGRWPHSRGGCGPFRKSLEGPVPSAGCPSRASGPQAAVTVSLWPRFPCVTALVPRRRRHHPNVSFRRDIPQPPLPPGPLGRQGVALQDSPTMASACPFVCPRAKLRSLLQDSPAAGLGTVSPLSEGTHRGKR